VGDNGFQLAKLTLEEKCDERVIPDRKKGEKGEEVHQGGKKRRKWTGGGRKRLARSGWGGKIRGAPKSVRRREYMEEIRIGTDKEGSPRRLNN